MSAAIYSIEAEEALISSSKLRSTGMASLSPLASPARYPFFDATAGGVGRRGVGSFSSSSSSSSSYASVRWRTLLRNLARSRVFLVFCVAITCCLLLSFLGVFVFAPPTSNSVSSRLEIDDDESKKTSCDCRRDCADHFPPQPKSALKKPDTGTGVIEAANARGAPGATKHKLSVIVPFRDRFDELMLFVPNLSRFLVAQNVAFEILVINQVSGAVAPIWLYLCWAQS